MIKIVKTIFAIFLLQLVFLFLILGTLINLLFVNRADALFDPQDGYFFSAWFLLGITLGMYGVAILFYKISSKIMMISKEEAKQAVRTLYQK